MEFNKEMSHTIQACAIIFFLVVDLYFIDNVVTVLIGQISNQQYVTTGMMAKNQTTAPTYASQGLENQRIDIVIGGIILIFLGYIGKHTVGLLRTIIECEKNKPNEKEYNKASQTYNKNPKHHFIG